MKNSKSQIFSNFAWRLAERIGAKGIYFIVMIFLARLLDPKDYGMVALITVIVNVLQVFVDSGFGNALIQKEKADDVDFSTVFIFNMIICIILYLGLFFSSPWIAEFYNDSSMIPVIRVVGITILISGVKNIQQAYVSRNMMFKKFFFSTLGGTLFSGIIGIILAYYGAGVWALVAQNLLNTLIDTIILWITVDWRPKAVFSKERLKKLFGFGWKLLLSSLIETLYSNLRNLIIGKKYSKSDLAYYDNGFKLPGFMSSTICSSITSVLFPVLSQEQDRPEYVKAYVRRAIQICSYILWPMMFGMMACSEPIIKILLTDKWLPAVPYFRIACFTCGLLPIHLTNLQAITAMGRSDIFLKLEIAKKIVGLSLIFISMPFGVLAMAKSTIVGSIISTVINSWPNRRLLDYSYWEQIRDILPSMMLSAFMAIIVWSLEKISLPVIILFAVQIIAGVIIYVLGSKILKFESYKYVLDNAKQLKKRFVNKR